MAETVSASKEQNSVCTQPSFIYRFIKRTLDIIISCCVIFITFIPVLVCALAIVIDSKGSPFFTCQRLGKDGVPFKMFKLRTMKMDAEDFDKHLSDEQRIAWQQEHKIPDDPRVTKVGSFLRKTSLDELPQFINVLMGDMSIVGPRPIERDEIRQYGDSSQMFLSAKPGITGYWQVYARNDATYETGRRQEMELYYITHQSLWFDIKIFFKTFVSIFNKTGL